MSRIAKSVAFFALAFMTPIGARASVQATSVYGKGRVETFELSMPELSGRKRMIRVHLPAAYDTTDASRT